MMPVDRRTFLRRHAALIAAAPAVDVLLRLAEDGDHQVEVDRRFWKPLSGQRTQCFICPMHCVLNPGETCFCRTRNNVDGRLLSFAYNNPCILTLDPIEKLPLAHVLPGTPTLALGVGGCNLRCQYCQNWEQSQSKPEKLKHFDLPGDRAVAGARKRECRTIAYTYTEPVAFYEYLAEVAALARKNGLRNVCASAMYVDPEPVRAIAPHLDAVAVALKSFDAKFYDRVLGAELKPVLEAIVTLKAEKVWTEVVTLVVPTYNDDLATIRAQCHWHRANLGADTPLHFGRFVPEHQLKNLPRTPEETLNRCRAIALEAGLKYVYVFNLSPHEGNHTYCPGCKQEVITRLGFKVLENRMKGAACAKCGTKIPGVWT